jgi:hypothetical protein
LQTGPLSFFPPPIVEEDEIDASVINPKLIVEIALEDQGEHDNKKMTPVVYMHPYTDDHLDRAPSR